MSIQQEPSTFQARVWADAADRLRRENWRLQVENWQLRGALGYEVPSDVPEGNFKCGFCDARRNPR
jgi:hypothetical protein